MEPQKSTQLTKPAEGVQKVIGKVVDLPTQVNTLVDHPEHYNKHLSGIECIQVVQHFNFNMGNAIKYIWRADDKGNPIQDLEKAIKYLQFEIQRRSK